MSYLIVTPATALLQNLFTRSVVQDLSGRLRAAQDEFVTFYNGTRQGSMA
jgi:hypothetical protein